MGNSSQFKKGHKTWNKGMKGLQISPKSQFKKGENVGDKNASWKDGVQKPKNDCVYINDGCNSRKRRPRLIYKEAYVEIPKGYVIVHLDGDKYNDSLMNLEAISRAENLKRNNQKRKKL
jgi:hypothetical protein